MAERFVTMADVKDAVQFKLSHYKEWLDAGIIDQKEFDEYARVLNSLETSLLFRSKNIETPMEAV